MLNFQILILLLEHLGFRGSKLLRKNNRFWRKTVLAWCCKECSWWFTFEFAV